MLFCGSVLPPSLPPSPFPVVKRLLAGVRCAQCNSYYSAITPSCQARAHDVTSLPVTVVWCWPTGGRDNLCPHREARGLPRCRLPATDKKKNRNENTPPWPQKRKSQKPRVRGIPLHSGRRCKEKSKGGGQRSRFICSLDRDGFPLAHVLTLRLRAPPARLQPARPRSPVAL